MPLTKVSCPETEKRRFSRNLDPIFFIKKKKIKNPVFWTVQRTPYNYFECSKSHNMPGGFLSILLHFFIPFPAQQFKPWECSNNTKHLKMGERGRKTEICLPTHNHLYTPSDKQQNETNLLLGNCTFSYIFYWKRGAKTCSAAPAPLKAEITCDLFCLTLSPPAITSHTRLSEKEY